MKHTALTTTLLLTVLCLISSAASASTWYVDGVNGNDTNDCKSRQHACKTIGHAISLASSSDSIMVAAATYAENLSIGISLKLIGSSATTIIDGGAVNRVVTISSPIAHVTLSNLTMRNGFGNTRAGGIYNVGTLTINKSTISGNVALGFSGLGGGIYNDGGVLTINNSTISGNTAGKFADIDGSGGGIFTAGALTINNSTISGNTASGTHFAYGGGIYSSSALTTINNSTISGNTARGGSISEGGGIYTGTTTILQNSTVAGNSGSGNCFGTITSNGYNLSSDGSCNFNNTGDLNNTDPKLGQLGNYGGPTQTIPLLSGSPAIDAGNPSGCTDGQGHLLKTDQRGKPRPDHEDTGGCDMGAYESQSD